MSDTASAPRVCIVGSGWRFTSGISYYTCRVASALSPRSGVSVVLLRRLIPRFLYPGRRRVGHAVNSIDYPPDVPVFDGIDWFAFPSILSAMRFMRRTDPQVMLLQWWTGAVLHNYYLLILFARRRGIRVVVEFHEVQDTGEARLHGAQRYMRVVADRVLKSADAYVVHSEHDRQAVAQAYPPARVLTEVVPHGPFDHLAPQLPDVVGPDRSAEPTTVLFFGTIRPYKGLEHLIDAYDGLAHDDAQRLRLLVVGETWEGWTEPLRRAATSRYSGWIEVVNRYVSDSEVAAFFARSDAVVLPYLRSSASGPLHIAMSFGLPVVLSDVGGLRDGAEGYEGITWTPPGEIQPLQEALRQLPGMRGRRYADPRSWSHTADRLEDVFRRVLTS